MNGNLDRERPEVYALRQEDGNWQISRRDFLKAAGISAAALGIGLNSRLVRPAFAEESLESLCRDAPSHQETINNLIPSADGKYLLSVSQNVMKCWDFENYALLSSRDVSGISYITTSMIGGKSRVIYLKSGENKLTVRELPDIGAYSDRSIAMDWIGSSLIQQLDSDGIGNLYVLLLDQVQLSQKTWSVAKIKTKDGIKSVLDETETLYTSSEEILAFAVFDNERKLLLVTGEKTIRIVDLTDGSVTEPKLPPLSVVKGFAIQPGETAVLYPEQNGSTVAAHFGLASLVNGSMIWSKYFSNPKPNVPKILNSAVTPDGSLGLLLGEQSGKVLWTVSMQNGNLRELIDLGSTSWDCTAIAVTRDGSKLAVAGSRSILFISLPNLNIIGCPVDLSEMKDNSKGIEVAGTDPLTGTTITYTLPCGAAIPPGAVCTCNCVAGSIPSCSCVGHTSCSCNSHTTTYSSHYWHPN